MCTAVACSCTLLLLAFWSRNCCSQPVNYHTVKDCLSSLSPLAQVFAITYFKPRYRWFNYVLHFCLFPARVKPRFCRCGMGCKFLGLNCFFSRLQRFLWELQPAFRQPLLTCRWHWILSEGSLRTLWSSYCSFCNWLLMQGSWNEMKSYGYEYLSASVKKASHTWNFSESIPLILCLPREMRNTAAAWKQVDVIQAAIVRDSDLVF